MKIITNGMEAYTVGATVVLKSRDVLAIEYTDADGKQQTANAVVRGGMLRLEYPQGTWPFTQS